MATAAPATAAAPTAGGGWVDPFRAFLFRIEIQGVTQGYFAECSSPSVRINVITHAEGGSLTVHRLPGAVEHAAITLRIGLTRSRELWDWMEGILKGKDDPRNISIVVLERDGTTEAMRWNLIKAWPSEYCGAPLNAGGSELAIESITLVFESMNRA